jgi:hypothetical protein
VARALVAANQPEFSEREEAQAALTPSHPARASAITIDQVLAEIEREAQSRARAYPAMIAEAAPDRRSRRAGTAPVPSLGGRRAPLSRLGSHAALRPHQPQARVLGFTADRRQGLARELDRRARLYPKWIAAGTLDPAAATSRPTASPFWPISMMMVGTGTTPSAAATLRQRHGPRNRPTRPTPNAATNGPPTSTTSTPPAPAANPESNLRYEQPVFTDGPPQSDGLPMADFHITESGDGSIGVMYGSMWIAIPREAHAALFKFCASVSQPEPSNAPNTSGIAATAT